MKPPKPLPAAPPFLSIYTTAFRRPRALARNIESVGRQTATASLEQLVVPDHVGYGIVGGLYGRFAWYAPALRGDYVLVLPDDDALADDDAVAALERFARQQGSPEVILAAVEKNGRRVPAYPPGAPPTPGDIDLCCLVVRRDVWLRHLGDWGDRYQGDFDMALALHNAGYAHARFDGVLATGTNSNGRPEMDY